jgi:hypothetical protein
MNKIGLRIKADPAGFQFYCGFPQFAQMSARQTDIDGFSGNVQAMFCNAAARFTKHGIGGRGTIPADHMKRLDRVEFSGKSEQKIKQLGINGADIISSEIPEDMIYFFQSAV